MAGRTLDNESMMRSGVTSAIAKGWKRVLWPPRGERGGGSDARSAVRVRWSGRPNLDTVAGARHGSLGARGPKWSCFELVGRLVDVLDRHVGGLGTRRPTLDFRIARGAGCGERRTGRGFLLFTVLQGLRL